MSVTASIVYPESSQREAQEIPVCTYSIFKKYIVPVAEVEGLGLIRGWGTLIEVDSENVFEFSKQVEILIANIQNNFLIVSEVKERLVGRLKEVVQKTSDAISLNSEVKIYFG